MFYEENILASRLKKSNYRVGIIPDIFYIHNQSTSIKKALSLYKTYKINLQSKYYYQKTYNKINFFQEMLLKIAMKYSLIEKIIIIIVKSIKK